MSYRKLFIFFNLAMLASFIAAFVLDYNADWKKHQKEYYRQASAALERKAAAASDPEEKKALLAEAAKLKRTPLEIKQIITKDLGRVDRCTTCHVGMDEYVNPSMANDFTKNPFKAHPNAAVLNGNHPFQKYGCTACHQGQGLATTAKAAHGKVMHWEKPMLEGKLIQASCAKCHANFETLKGAEVAALGKKLFNKHGCQGCHSIRGVGGIISVDLGDIADKPVERIAGYNFDRVLKLDSRTGKMEKLHHSHHEDEWNIQNWILGHLTNDPIVVTPNDPFAQFNPEPVAPSGMPDFREELGHSGAEAITAYLMSMSAEQLPHRYFVPAPAKPEPRFANNLEHGKHVFEKYGCQGCHGLGGVKGRRNYNALGPGQEDPKKDMDKGQEPTLVDVVGTYTHEELKKRISAGVPASAVSKFNEKGPVPPLYMPAWKDKIKGKELDDLASWLLSIAKKDDSGF
ncbi:MAG: cytochrome c [Elusimicrobia bacterium]|nr:cytochrome c [Elusimicrobiota bacterium]